MDKKGIKKEIISLKREWLEIKQIAEKQSFLSVGKLQDSLINHLESVRASIEEYFYKFPHTRKLCKAWLGKILDISEELKINYVLPATYEESFTIFDTIKMVDKKVFAI